MSIGQVLKELKIDKPGSYVEDDLYEIDLVDSNEFGKMYSKLESNDATEEKDELTQMTLDSAKITYDYKDVEITIDANMIEDEYKLYVKSKEKENKDEEDS